MANVPIESLELKELLSAIVASKTAFKFTSEQRIKASVDLHWYSKVVTVSRQDLIDESPDGLLHKKLINRIISQEKQNPLGYKLAIYPTDSTLIERHKLTRYFSLNKYITFSINDLDCLKSLIKISGLPKILFFIDDYDPTFIDWLIEYIEVNELEFEHESKLFIFGIEIEQGLSKETLVYIKNNYNKDDDKVLRYGLTFKKPVKL